MCVNLSFEFQPRGMLMGVVWTFEGVDIAYYKSTELMWLSAVTNLLYTRVCKN
ncbi:hypothetical protein HanIR_Chr17g0870401 [Helianthus annuus]|nr:hypothetical protein HanIR_Chr17g0870401 [Helianthus annuus]